MKALLCGELSTEGWRRKQMPRRWGTSFAGTTIACRLVRLIRYVTSPLSGECPLRSV